MSNPRARTNKKKKNPNFGKGPSERTDRESVRISPNKCKYKKK